jgi:adenosylmethionine-8-amino-7-oxononanoate aminotransferase
MFGAQRYGYEPDIITCAKGITSGYSPLGALLVTDRVYGPFTTGATTLYARLHLRRPPGLLRGRPGEPRRDGEGRVARPRPGQRGGVPLDPGEAARQLAPPLICDQQHFDEIEQILRNVLTDAWTHI